MSSGLSADRATSIFSKSSTEGARASSCSSCVVKLKLSVADSTAMEMCQSRYDCPTKAVRFFARSTYRADLGRECFQCKPLQIGNLRKRRACGTTTAKEVLRMNAKTLEDEL